MKKISLIIPCFNEAENIPGLLVKCHQAFVNNSEVEVILVDNGSVDKTQEILQEYLPRYPFARSIRVEKNQGYGFGILNGLNAANAEYVGWTHADLQTDPADVLQALELLKQSKEPLFLKGKRYGRRLGDLFFTVGMSLFEIILLRTVLWDINAQPNIMPKSFVDSWRKPPHDFSLDLYAYYSAKKAGLKIKRFSVLFGKRVAGEAHLNSLKAKLRYTMRTIRFSFSLKRLLSS